MNFQIWFTVFCLLLALVGGVAWLVESRRGLRRSVIEVSPSHHVLRDSMRRPLDNRLWRL